MSEKAFDAAVHHRIGLGRYSSWLVRRILAQLNHNERAIVAKVAEMGPDGASAGRLELLIEALRLLQAEGWLVIKRRVTEDLAQLAGAEAEFAAKLVRFTGARGTFSPAPAVAQVWAAVVARPFQGRFLQGWLDGAEEAAARRVRETVRQGFIDGQPTAEIVRALRGTKARQYRDGVLEGSRRGVEAMVRTAVTHTSNVAHQEVYRANADIIEGVEWVSVLDSRTTLLCASRDRKVYPIDSGPRPPAHVGCRSVTVPKVGDIPGVEPFKRPTYAEWLAKQPASVQDDILGPTRGRLYRSGGLKIESFVDRKGSTLSLEELQRRDAAAFQRAGVSA